MQNSDPRNDNQKIKMAKHFDDHREQYDNDSTHEIVYEDDEKVIVADHSGHELNQWTDESSWELTREELRDFSRSAADEFMGKQESHAVFSTAEPVVFDKFE